MISSSKVCELYAEYEAGATLEDIGLRVGVSYRTVGRWFESHYLRIRSKSENATGCRNSSFVDGPITDPYGYIWLWDESRGKRVMEHRLVMEKEIGRELSSDEIVHHLDEDPSNNHPSNLVVTDREGHRHYHKLAADKWSKNHECCIKCGGTSRKHASRGLCTKCNQRLWQRVKNTKSAA